MNKKKAFTLVELLVVIAIIAILATAGVVGYTVFTEKARKSNAESELNQAKTLLEAEAFANANFEIGTTIAFPGLYYVDSAIATSGTEAQEVDMIRTDEAYTAALKYILAHSEDTELKALESNFRYSGGNVIMVSTSNPKYEASWTLSTGAVKGAKI